MSANGPESDVALAQQVEATARECAALRSAISRGRRNRFVLLLLLIVFVLGVCWAFYGLFQKVSGQEFQDQLLAKAQERLEKNQDEYLKEVNALVDNVGPTVQETFMEQVKKDLPKFVQSAEKERDAFAKTIEEQLQAKLDAQYTQMLEQQQKTLQTEFKEVQDPKLHERMMSNIDRAVLKMVKRYYIDEMQSQFQTFFAAWDDFPSAATPRPEEDSLETQLIGALFEMLRYKLAHPQGLALR
jgi:hypothetical protein